MKAFFKWIASWFTKSPKKPKPKTYIEQRLVELAEQKRQRRANLRSYSEEGRTRNRSYSQASPPMSVGNPTLTVGSTQSRRPIDQQQATYNDNTVPLALLAITDSDDTIPTNHWGQPVSYTDDSPLNDHFSAVHSSSLSRSSSHGSNDNYRHSDNDYSTSSSSSDSPSSPSD